MVEFRSRDHIPALHGRIIEVDSHEIIPSLDWDNVFEPASGEVAIKADFILSSTIWSGIRIWAGAAVFQLTTLTSKGASITFAKLSGIVVARARGTVFRSKRGVPIAIGQRATKHMPSVAMTLPLQLKREEHYGSRDRRRSAAPC